jgi:hypothetical protein
MELKQPSWQDRPLVTPSPLRVNEWPLLRERHIIAGLQKMRETGMPFSGFFRLDSESARLLLSKKVAKNRPLRKLSVPRYKKLIQEDKWIVTHQGIGITWLDEMMDGQHRCLAIIELDVTIPCHIVIGLPPESFAAVDRGVIRNLNDIFAIHGEVDYGTLAGASMFVWRYKNDRAGDINSENIPDPEALWQFMDREHPLLREFIKSSRDFVKTGFGMPSRWMALRYLCDEHNNSETVENFFYQVATGNDINDHDPNHPVNRLRSRLNEDIVQRKHGKGMDGRYRAALVIKAWNAYKKGQKIHRLSWRTDKTADAPFPKIL